MQKAELVAENMETYIKTYTINHRTVITLSSNDRP